jgi:transcriptional regulator with XRE-family HTH domain
MPATNDRLWQVSGRSAQVLPQFEHPLSGAYRLAMTSSSSLGDYLRARRALVAPQEANVSAPGRRRVPGFRREELAVLAGISSDYYLRLEQGRDHHPSARVIDALARALRLDEAATAHLRTLAHLPPVNRSENVERVAPSIERMIKSWPLTPAFVYGRRLDVLAVNDLVVGLLPFLSPGVNLVRATFLDPEVRKYVPDWEGITDRAVARLRALAGVNTKDPRLVELVREMSECSERFRHLWAQHDIEVSASPTRRFTHPEVGTLELQSETLEISATPGQYLGVFHAEPHTFSARALSRLARRTAATSRQKKKRK